MFVYLFQKQMKSYGCENRQILKLYDGSLTSYLNQLCLKNLFDLKDYKKQLFKLFHIRKKIPLYIRADLLLIPLANVNDYNIIYINYFKVKRYTIFHKSVKIFMVDGITLEYHHGIESFNRLIEISKSIINIKEGKTNG